MNQAEWKVLAVEALTKSIEHWNRHATDTALSGEGVGTGDCACCTVFLRRPPLEPCAACPVALRTEKSSCAETPWISCSTYWTGLGSCSKGDASRFRTSAVRMRIWLEDTLTLVKADRITLRCVEVKPGYHYTLT